MRRQSRRKFLWGSILGAIWSSFGLTVSAQKRSDKHGENQRKYYHLARQIPYEDNYDVIVSVEVRQDPLLYVQPVLEQ